MANDFYTLQCEEPGCPHGPATGHALHRTSPKGEGQTFKGRCSDHMGEAVDPVVADIVGAIEDRNQQVRWGETDRG